jgi:two-component system response regulator AgrA
MLKIYICEDDIEQRSHLKKVIENIILMEDYDMELECVAADPHVLLDKVRKSENVGIYFLDIDLKSDMTGLELAQEIRKYDPRGFIIIVTTHSEMSYMAFTFKLEALDFILKDEQDEMDKRVFDCILKANQRFASASNKVQANFSIKVGGKVYTVDYDEILFFETSSNAHKIILHCKTRQMEFPGKIKEIEKELDDRFYRCHRAYLVNKDNIKEVDLHENVIHMVGGDECLLSHRKAALLKKYVHD